VQPTDRACEVCYNMRRSHYCWSLAVTIRVELSKILDAMSAQSLKALEPPDSFPLVYYRVNFS
jgi:hypothetical protein